MHYEINVAMSGNHLFATAERSGMISEFEARNLFTIIKNKFPESENYEVSITLWKKEGKTLNFNLPRGT